MRAEMVANSWLCYRSL